MLSFEFFDRWAGPIAGVVAVLGAGAVIWRSVRPAGPRRRRGGAYDFACSVCGRAIVYTKRDLTAVSPIAKGLIIRTFPGLAARTLAELPCPSCEAVHCFIAEGKTPEWVGANLYQPGGSGAKCMECGCAVRNPPWPAGMYDGRIASAPRIAPDTGMTCGRCGAVVCHACAHKNSFGRLKEGAYRCPRCARGGITGFHHGP